MRAKIHMYMLALMKTYGFFGGASSFLAVPLKVEKQKSKTHAQSHFSAHTVWLFRCGTFGKHKPKVPGIHEQRTV